MENKQKSYNLMYSKIKPNVINLVRDLIINKKYFKQDINTKYEFLKLLLNDLCRYYSITEDKQTTLLYIPSYVGFTDCYNQIENIICISEKMSLITFLHEFKHFLQHINNKPNNEDIARGYSLSLFYKASEKHYKRALEKGLILYQEQINK